MNYDFTVPSPEQTYDPEKAKVVSAKSKSRLLMIVGIGLTALVLIPKILKKR